MSDHPPLHKPHPTDGNGYIVIPKWFVSFLSFLCSIVFVGAVIWAWSISNDVSAIKAEVRTQNELRSSELEDMRRRLNRHDSLLDRILERITLFRGREECVLPLETGLPRASTKNRGIHTALRRTP